MRNNSSINSLCGLCCTRDSVLWRVMSTLIALLHKNRKREGLPFKRWAAPTAINSRCQPAVDHAFSSLIPRRNAGRCAPKRSIPLG